MAGATRTNMQSSSTSTKTDQMVRIEGGTFMMGGDRYYREEAPAHRVSVGSFWIAPTPVTNAQCARFVEATGHVTVAERAGYPRLYPGAKAERSARLRSLFDRPSGRVDLRNPLQLVVVSRRRRLAPSSRAGDFDRRSADHPVVHVAFEDVAAYANGSEQSSRRKRSGSSPREAA